MWVTPPNNNNNKKQVYLNLGLRTAALQWAHKFLDNTQCSEWRFNITFGMGFFFFFFFFCLSFFDSDSHILSPGPSLLPNSHVTDSEDGSRYLHRQR